MNTRRLLVPVVSALALAACAHQGSRMQTESADTPDPATEAQRHAAAAPIRARAPAADPAPPAAAPSLRPRAGTTAPVEPDAPIGVLSCDAYLGRYRACHRTITDIAPEQIDERRRRLHASLHERARDPAQRETLTSMCDSMQKTMDEALRGRACGLPRTRAAAFVVE
jgi:hypothetical protein